MKVRLMCVVAMWLVAGCTVMTPDVFRQKSRHVWRTDVSGEYQNIHNRMVAAMHGVGWGEAVRIQNVTDLELGRCSTWAGYPDRREPLGFIIDTQRLDEGMSRVTVTARTKWYAGKGRALAEKTLGLEGGR